MKHNVVTPSVGESITEVSILKWHKQSGQAVKTGELLLEIESDKATVEVVAEHAGVLTVLKEPGVRMPIGEVIGVIDDAGKATVSTSAAAAPAAAPSQAKAAPMPAPTSPTAAAFAGGGPVRGSGAVGGTGPAARKIASERGLDPSALGHGAPALGAPVANGNAVRPANAAPPLPAYVDRPGDRRVPMTTLRARIAERLVQAQHTAAILTTFNEADMSAVMALRNKHKDAFKTKNGVALSFMSFFTFACIEALKIVPEVNASVDGKDVIYRDYFDIGIAVGTERGLVVPVVRDTHKLSLVAFEKKVTELAEKARTGKLSIADLSGGTFTISNGGTYGSLMSTPILNPPQSGILGMHKIMDRPVAIDGKVEIRPMMYLALSYDHRIIDGKGAVTFLVQVKDLIEHPEKLKMEL